MAADSVRASSNLELSGALNFKLNASGFPAKPKVGMSFVKDGILYNYQTVGSTLLWVPISLGIQSASHNQGEASDLWTITHNLGVKSPWYVVLDLDGNALSATQSIVDKNSFTLSFASPVAGSCITICAASVDVPSINAESVTVDNAPVLTATSDVATAIHNSTTKSDITDTSEFGFWDSVSQNLRKLTFASLKSRILSGLESVYQALDAYTAKTNVAQTWNASQCSARITSNTASFDLSAAGNNYQSTPTAAFEIAFTNIATNIDKSGYITFVKTTNYVATAAANTSISTADLTTLSGAGTFIAPYLCDGTNVAVLGVWKKP